MVIYIKNYKKYVPREKKKKKKKTKEWFDFAFGWNLLIKLDPTKG